MNTTTLLIALMLTATAAARAAEPADSTSTALAMIDDAIDIIDADSAATLPALPPAAITPVESATSRSGLIDRWKRILGREFHTRQLGIEVGYTIKWWTVREGGRKRRCTFFGDSGHNSGVIFGVPWQPVVWRGLALDTGVFGVVYACKDNRDVYRVEDIGMLFPVRAMYRVAWAREGSAFITTGPSLDVGIRLNLKIAEDTDAGTQRLDYNDDTPRRVNWFWDIGVGVNLHLFKLQVIYSMGLTPNKHFFSTNSSGVNYVTVYPARISFTGAVMF